MAQIIKLSGSSLLYLGKMSNSFALSVNKWRQLAFYQQGGSLFNIGEQTAGNFAEDFSSLNVKEMATRIWFTVHYYTGENTISWCYHRGHVSSQNTVWKTGFAAHDCCGSSSVTEEMIQVCSDAQIRLSCIAQMKKYLRWIVMDIKVSGVQRVSIREFVWKFVSRCLLF